MSVPHWSGPEVAPRHAYTHIRAHPQPVLTELVPATMRLSLLLLLGAWAVPEGLGDRAFLSASAPHLDEEEKYSAHMPAHLRCDACKAVAYQVSLSPLGSPGPCQILPEPGLFVYFGLHHWSSILNPQTALSPRERLP